MFNSSNDFCHNCSSHTSQRNTDAYDSYVVKIESNESNIDNFIKNGHKYCALLHNTSYKVIMTNNTDLRANAILRIDGEIMGKWRLNAYSDIIIERPTHNNRKFTFVQEDSWEGKMGGIKQGDNMNGIVEVTFIPEERSYDNFDYDYDSSIINDPWRHLKEADLPFPDTIYVSNKFGKQFPLTNNMPKEPRGFSMQNSFDGIEPQGSSGYESYGVGGTVLGGSSGQHFGSASHIIEDLPNKQIKRIRLIIKKTRPRDPYVSIKTKKYVDSDNSRYDDQLQPQLKKSVPINPQASDSWSIWPF